MTTTRSRSAQALGLVVCVLACFAAGALGAIASVDAPTFYAELEKPSFAPPASVFGPVWTALYTAMAVAVWSVWRAPQRRARALPLFAAQLAVNALWSWLFFAWHLGAAAFAEILLLVVLVAWTALEFRRSSRLAAALLLPYLAWVAFAAVLTWTLWRANPGLL
ncbi:MAG: TspO/MBR family protein [Planctomycetota bacterium]